MQALLLSHSNGTWAPGLRVKDVYSVPKYSAQHSLGFNACWLPRQAQVGTARAACLGREERAELADSNVQMMNKGA